MDVIQLFFFFSSEKVVTRNDGYLLPKKVPSEEVCDATMTHSSNAAGSKKITAHFYAA